MVRTYRRNSTRGSYSRQSIRDAVRAIKGGMSLYKATALFNIPRTTFRRRLVSDCPGSLGRFKPVFYQEYEAIQHRFTKRLPEFNLFTYDDRCARLGIDRLELRRLRADLILCYKLLHGLVSLSSEDFFTIVRNHATSGHTFKLFLSESRVNCRQHFFVVRIVTVWNSLPDEVVSVDSLSLFIKRLRAVDLSDFLMDKL